MRFFSALRLVLGTLRVGRMIMFILITGSVTYGLGGSWRSVLLAALIGTTLSGGGFYLDFVADYKKDRESGKLSNPIAMGIVSPRVGVIIVILFLTTSAFLCLLLNAWALLPWGCVILVVSGLAVGILDKPILRAFSLGVLQGFYVLIGALAAHRIELGVILMVFFLFFAMTGGRVLGDVRDLPYDSKTDTMTIPKKYGIRWASAFYFVNEVIAYVLAFLVYLTGLFAIGYLYCIVAMTIIGLIFSIIYISRPSPEKGHLTNMFSFGVLGMLFVLGMILGRI